MKTIEEHLYDMIIEICADKDLLSDKTTDYQKTVKIIDITRQYAALINGIKLLK